MPVLLPFVLNFPRHLRLVVRTLEPHSKDIGSNPIDGAFYLFVYFVAELLFRLSVALKIFVGFFFIKDLLIGKFFDSDYISAQIYV